VKGKVQKHKLEFLKKLSDITPKPTAHGSGKKYVFRKNEEMSNASTQIAFGHFRSGEVCEEHVHESMFEYFFFISGEGTYIIEGVLYSLEPNMFLEIPAGSKHSLHADKGKDLRFIYWGVSID